MNPEQHLREDYNYERTRQKELYGHLSAPVTISFGLGAVLWYLIQSFTYSWWTIPTTAYVLSNIIAGLWYFAALWKVRDYIERYLVLGPSSTLWANVRDKHETKEEQVTTYEEQLRTMINTLHKINNRRDTTLRNAYRYFGISFMFMLIAAFQLLIR